MHTLYQIEYIIFNKPLWLDGCLLESVCDTLDACPLVCAVLCRFQHVFCYHADHALYTYVDPGSGQKRLAKFTGQYGIAVHAAWVSARLAPTLLICRRT